MKFFILTTLAALIVGCSASSSDGPDDMAVSDIGSGEITSVVEILPETSEPWGKQVRVVVTLDGEPTEGITISQGGRVDRWLTDKDGVVVVSLDTEIPGDMAIIASHPDARIEAAMVWEGLTETTIDLDRFDPNDNEAYLFQNPGEPGHSPTSAQCGHCHVTIAEDFFASSHPWSASNPVLQDLFAGTSAARQNQADCEAAGGQWRMGLIPGTQEPGERCYIGDGVLPTLNDCGTNDTCDDKATKFGGCADCHAPGIDGKLGGRDLLEAKGFAYERGIHCDVCHHVEGIDDDGAPGNGGRLKIVRPSDPAETPSFGDWRPLLFGPHDDIPNPFMGIVQRMVYRESRFCFGCHELEREVIVPGETIDSARWPDGKLPLLSTFSEWQESGMTATCQSCHMPSDPDVDNTADLQLFPTTVGVAGGWPREKPAVRRHIWLGPRTEGRPLAAMSATVELESEVGDGELTVTATTSNGGAAHAIPTGEPLRSLVLQVEARCDDEPLIASGGTVIPDFGGYAARKAANEDWTIWPAAKVGQTLRIVKVTSDFHDYPGIGPFGDGTFDAPAKGMPVEELVGSLVVTKVEDGLVSLDGELPEGDVAYLVDSAGKVSWQGLAGAPGFAFARVLVGPQGERMVPHYQAIDVASDNRLMPGKSYATTHRFQSACDAPQVTARLLYRGYPLQLALERGWEMPDDLLIEVTK
jgi:hypothetical protein